MQMYCVMQYASCLATEVESSLVGLPDFKSGVPS